MSGSRDRTIKLWNTLGDCKFTITEKGHTEWVSCVRFSPNPQNPVIVSAGWDKLVKVRIFRSGCSTGPSGSRQRMLCNFLYLLLQSLLRAMRTLITNALMTLQVLYLIYYNRPLPLIISLTPSNNFRSGSSRPAVSKPTTLDTQDISTRSQSRPTARCAHLAGKTVRQCCGT